MNDLSYENYYENCQICPRACKVNRRKGELGFCKVPAQIQAARAALHMWEEPCISGEEGSGAVFFSGCSLRCCFCQNGEISAGQKGEIITPERLCEIFFELQEKKANNINLVTAGQFLPSVAEAIRLAKKKGIAIPFVYNSSGYEKVSSLQMLDGLIDIYLPDFKYMDEGIAGEYSKAKDYPQIAKAAIREMVRQVPKAEFDERGMMKKGVIVRHLVLPGHVRNSREVLEYLYTTYKDQIYISIMNQYTPMPAMSEHKKLYRKVTKREYETLLDYAIDLGMENGFIQEGGTVGESFIPAFDGEGVSR